MRKMKWLVIAGVILIALTVGVSVLLPSATVRYRLTLVVEKDGKPVIGSAVSEVSYQKNLRILGASSDIVIDTRGEAVAVDLGSRGVLFALRVAGEDPRSGPEYMVLRAFRFPYGSVPDPLAQGFAQIRSLRGKADLPLSALPMLVRFRDMANPETVELVDPNDLAKTFGPGVKLVRALIEIVPRGIWPFSWYGITGEPITNEIERRLPWLSRYYDRQLDGRRFETIAATNRVANSLSAGAFKTGR